MLLLTGITYQGKTKKTPLIFPAEYSTHISFLTKSKEMASETLPQT